MSPLRINLEKVPNFYLEHGDTLTIHGVSGAIVELEGGDYGGPIKVTDHNNKVIFDDELYYQETRAGRRSRLTTTLGADTTHNTQIDSLNLPADRHITAGGNLNITAYKRYVSKKHN